MLCVQGKYYITEQIVQIKPVSIGGSLKVEAVAQTCSLKKLFLEISQNSQKNTSARVSILIKNLIKIETLAHVFFCEFCEISKNTFSYRTPLVAASVKGQTYLTK